MLFLGLHTIAKRFDSSIQELPEQGGVKDLIVPHNTAQRWKAVEHRIEGFVVRRPISKKGAVPKSAVLARSFDQVMPEGGDEDVVRARILPENLMCGLSRSRCLDLDVPKT